MFKLSIQGRDNLLFYRFRCPKCSMAQFATAYKADTVCRCKALLPDVINLRKSESRRVNYFRTQRFPITTGIPYF